MPMLPFFVLSLITGTAAWWLRKARKIRDLQTREAEKAEEAKAEESNKPLTPEQDIQQVLSVDAFAIELGYSLLPLANKKNDGDLISRITGVRRSFARDMGIIVPPIAIRDNLELETNEYRFLLRNKEVARGSLVPNRWMAMNVSGSGAHLKGLPTVEPVFNLEAVWITEEEKKTAEVHGFTVVDAPSVLITHLTESLRDNAAMLLEREDTQKLIEMVKEKSPTLVSELLPDLVNVGLIQRVLQNLLREKIPIRNLTLILETIADFASVTKNPDDLAERVRRSLGQFFVPEYENEEHEIQTLTLEPSLERNLSNRVKRTQLDVHLMLDPQLAQHIISQLTPQVDRLLEEGLTPLLITTSELRLAFKRFFDPSFPRLVVLAYQEIPSRSTLRSAGTISAPLPNEQPVEASEFNPEAAGAPA